MQRDLDRLRKRKRVVRRLAVVLALSLMAAVVLLAMRACADRFQEPYNKEYRPMDMERHKATDTSS